MKYLLITLLLLSGCSTARHAPKGMDFACVAMSHHGVYARWFGNYTSLADAEKEAQTIINNLVENNVIPDSSFPVCSLRR